MASEIKNIAIPKETIKEAVLRTVRSRIEEINQKMNDICTNMRYFEKKYGMKTEEFYKKFVSGTLGDDMDFFEWKASTEIYNELREEKKLISRWDNAPHHSEIETFPHHLHEGEEIKPSQEMTFVEILKKLEKGLESDIY